MSTPPVPRSHPHPWRARAAHACIALACLLPAACASVQPPRNPPLPAVVDRSAQYRMENLQPGPGNSDTLLISLTFSGGGTRSAAASYHLLDALRRQPVVVDGRSTTLLDEVDFISAISGGSLAAAYYGLYRERFFDAFPQRVLRRDLQGAMLRGALAPARLRALSSPYYGRGDYLADRLDAMVFDGKRFADLPRRRPLIRIGATDMIDGRRIEFSQESFDALCSDLGPVPIARAVAASAAVPGLFSPVNLADYSDTGQCPGHDTPQRYRHLVDGGVVDNLGISGPLQAVARNNGLVNTLRAYGLRGIRHYVIVVLNVESDPRDPEDGGPKVPGFSRTVSAAINGNMRMDSQALAARLRARVAEWRRQIADDPGAVASGVLATRRPQVYLIEIGFDQVRDPALRTRLQSMSTALRISPEDEAVVAAFVHDTLRDSEQYQALLRALAEAPAAEAPPADGPADAMEDLRARYEAIERAAERP